MVALLGRLNIDVFHVEPIEQMPSQLPPSSRIIRTGHTISGEHPPGPELWTENDNTGHDQQQGYQHSIPLPSPLSDEALARGGTQNFEVHPFVFNANTRVHETVQ
jgi:hypothetical protein